MIAGRDAIFISHATPEDNLFTLWLGGRLTALGYTVFADILRLKGGDDWERILEDAIRNKAGRFLLVATASGVQKQGVRNEITIAVETAKRLKETGFIIPLRLTAFAAPLQIAHAQYINFERGWATGLTELLALLDETEIPRAATPDVAETWRSLQLKDAQSIGKGPETLISNWLSITSLPPSIHFYDFKSGISIGKAQAAISSCPLPSVAHNRGFLSFASIDQLQEHFGQDLPLELADTCETEVFLDSGWRSQRLAAKDCRPKFTDLSRQALDRFFEEKDLKPIEYADGRNAWWPTSRLATMDQHAFAWGDLKGRRQLVGRSDKRGFHWHYGVSCWARSGPVRHIRVSGKVIFTSNGHDLIGDARRAHRMRRSFCKTWRNDKWRDLLLAFWFWLAEGASSLDIPFGDGVAMRIALPPSTLAAPFGIKSPADTDTPDDDEEDGGLIVPDDEDDDPYDDDAGEE